MARPFINLSANELKEMARKNSSSLGTLQTILDELSYRKSRSARRAKDYVKLLLSELEKPNKAAQPKTNTKPRSFSSTEAQLAHKEMDQNPPRFNIHEKVRLRNNPRIGGVIDAEPIKASGGWQYKILISIDDSRFIKEEDLIASEEFERTKEGQIKFGNYDDLLRTLLLVKLQHPLADHLYALKSSRTLFEVYQFKPALKFLSNPDQRLLIADEVGLGKTIEAGIIYLELQARVGLQRVLIVCPASLRYKWQDEMQNRFDEPFNILDTNGLNGFFQDYDRHGESTFLRGITSLELLRRRAFQEQLIENNQHFDLVIIDEAHHCRNSGTLSHNVALTLSENADAMLLLTATPLHLGNQDLFHLLQILAPGEFNDSSTFEQVIEPNRFINMASRKLQANQISEAITELRKVEHLPNKKRFINNPYYGETLSLLKSPSHSQEQLVKAQTNLLELNTLSHIFTRTRKREVQTNAPVRKAYTLKFRFSPEERYFYESVINFVKQQYRLKNRSIATGWATIMRERQTASSIYAMTEFYQELTNSHARFTSEDLEQIYSNLSDEGENIDPYWEIEKVKESNFDQALMDLACANQLVGNIDSKFEVFRKSLDEILLNSPQSKLLVFSFFRKTLDYLYDRLIALGYSVKKIHGGIPVTERQSIVEVFRENNNINILLSSEVGSEGLDFQFCNTIFNYDLPWNPMKVEQRIGRIDRFGQAAPVVNIYNLVIEDSIEERIFSRLYDRIGIFKEAIGDLEAILGDEIRKLTQDIYSQNLTPAEEEQRAENVASVILRKKAEMENFERRKNEFMGQDAIFSSLIERKLSSGKYISELEIQSLIFTFFKRLFQFSKIVANDDNGQTYAIHMRSDFVKYMRDFVFTKRGTDLACRDFLKKLSDGEYLPITFKDTIAYDRKLIDYINIKHPLTQAAIEYWQGQQRPELPTTKLAITTETDHPGTYFYFVFLYHLAGINRQTELMPILVDSHSLEIMAKSGDQFLSYLTSENIEHAPNIVEFNEDLFRTAKRIAEGEAAEIREKKEEKLRKDNDALVNARLSAIEQSFNAKKYSLIHLRDTATDVRIRRMREGQLRNIEAGYKAKSMEIEKQREASVNFGLEFAGLIQINNSI